MKNLPLSLGVSALAGAFTLRRPTDWPVALRRAYVLAPGLLTAAGVAVVLFPGRARPAAVRAAVAAGAGAAVAGMQALSLRLDAGTEDWLSRRGVAAPRLWMAAATALASLGVDLLHDRDSNPLPEQSA
ncbi:hypothetical protein QNO00_10660 [Arthrobacter sp. zg-Y1219]|uniref:hypothetical protein n=1 Tax=Arthrobacter sp. zg-Y1219 TaxID=3049067 RepID=UPI0024C24A6B|nr:hypothetical protein [Arthrobacter sp. zg-Y1219]MDK1360725.1 hypothetical protein [Arthrobacter sp. zg-Y1219]